ncbi:hypothetical protein AA0117_g9979 [Alternaria alternata]|uniref:Uncharacterized protein n=1 Tax=Alternaria alternata TaxID=5599 RepID=A0A4Q4N588_ALTAL|nr:hypothetical protein AA0117_g9979 [Alternaria alternata]
MCIMKTYETRGRGVVDPPPRRGNFTSHPPAGVMRLPRDWQRTSVESFSDNGRYVEYRRSRSRPRAIEYIEEPRQEERAMLIHVEVTWTRGLRGEVSAVSGIDRARQSHTKLGVYCED